MNIVELLKALPAVGVQPIQVVTSLPNSAPAGSLWVLTDDTTAPTITAFVLPETANSLTVSIDTLIATDDVAVSAWLITESSTTPSAAAAGWVSSKPTSHTFASGGAKTAYAWAKDAAGNISAGLSASTTIDIPDAVAPVVTAFALPASANSLTVNVTTFTATDNVGVAGYLITESSSTPSPTNPGWSVSAPTTFTFDGTGFSGSGSKTAWAWVKDGQGNISAGAASSVTSVNLLPAQPSGASADASLGVFTMHPGTSARADRIDAIYTSDGSTPSAGNGTRLTSVTDGQQRTGLLNGTTYKIVFLGVNSYGDGAATNVISVTPTAAGQVVAAGTMQNGWRTLKTGAGAVTIADDNGKCRYKSIDPSVTYAVASAGSSHAATAGLLRDFTGTYTAQATFGLAGDNTYSGETDRALVLYVSGSTALPENVSSAADFNAMVAERRLIVSLTKHDSGSDLLTLRYINSSGTSYYYVGGAWTTSYGEFATPITTGLVVSVVRNGDNTRTLTITKSTDNSTVVSCTVPNTMRGAADATERVVLGDFISDDGTGTRRDYYNGDIYISGLSA